MGAQGISASKARFERFLVDLSGCKLQKCIDVPLQAKPFQVLRLLLLADGEVVSREQLHTALWPEETFGDFEHGVNTAVKKLRQALGDSVDQPGGAAVGWTPDGRLIYPRREPRPNQQDTNLWGVRMDSGRARPVGPPMRITSGTGIAVELSLSRDGKRMALRRHTPQSDVYIADLLDAGKRVGKPRRLTLDDRLDYVSAWTADGREVVFYSNRGGTFHVFRQAINATKPELLVGGKIDLYLPRLSPDGSSILYVVRPAPGVSDNARVMRVAVTGGVPQFLFEVPAL